MSLYDVMYTYIYKTYNLSMKKKYICVSNRRCRLSFPLRFAYFGDFYACSTNSFNCSAERRNATDYQWRHMEEEWLFHNIKANIREYFMPFLRSLPYHSSKYMSDRPRSKSHKTQTCGAEVYLHYHKSSRVTKFGRSNLD